jgi:hypothetical protein
MSETLPTIVTSAGLAPQTPASLNAQLIAQAQSLAPGLTANLPASLVEDMASTATGALVLIDQARVETVDSLTPYGANEWLLSQLGQIYLGQGSTASPATNTAVYVVFSGTVGFLIQPGFLVSDGTNQYAVQDGGVIETGGSSGNIFCLALLQGSFAVPANSVTTVVTSAPVGVSLTVTNPLAGTPGGAAQTAADYRAQVLQAGLVAATGTPDYVKTKIAQVTGVQPRLVAMRQQLQSLGGGWEIIVGGTGDPYAIGAAIYYGLFDVSTLVGSTLAVTGITNASPGVVTTNLNHGYTSGQQILIEGVAGMSGVNGTTLYADVIDQTHFSLYTNSGLTSPLNTTSSGSWTSGGVVTPNFRNTSVALNSYPDTYTVPFVIPPLQTVTMTVTWNTTSLNFVSPVGVTQLAQPALAAYINSIPVGAPINLFELQETFAASVVSILSSVLLTRMVFVVEINGVVVSPEVGTGIIAGDPESYFACSASGIVVTQG